MVLCSKHGPTGADKGIFMAAPAVSASTAPDSLVATILSRDTERYAARSDTEKRTEEEVLQILNLSRGLLLKKHRLP